MAALTAQQALPTSEALRQRALSRSWQRDRSVGVRRRLTRWAAWLLLTRIAPVAGIALLVLLPVHMFERASQPEAAADAPPLLRLAPALLLQRPRLAAPLAEENAAVPFLKSENRLHSKER